MTATASSNGKLANRVAKPAKEPKTLFALHGDRAYLLPTSREGTTGLLPAGNWTIEQHPINKEYSLRRVDPFVLPDKIYGAIPKQRDRILTTFGQRSGSTGVLLVGAKGSGKTLLAKSICAQAAQEGVPTVLVNGPHQGDPFSAFVQSIEQPCVFLFDEFEKTYSGRDSEGDAFDVQEGLLTLLDGVFPTHKLFLLTCNSRWRVDENLINRPGRIYYHLEFAGVDDDFIAEYCADRLEDQGHVKPLQALRRTLGTLNFDQLQALVEEMNRYGESPSEAVQMLNIKAHGLDRDRSFTVESVTGPNGKRLWVNEDDDVSGDPFALNAYVHYFTDKAKTKAKSLCLRGADLREVNGDCFTYEKGGVTVVLREDESKRESRFDLRRSFGWGD